MWNAFLDRLNNITCVPSVYVGNSEGFVSKLHLNKKISMILFS